MEVDKMKIIDILMVALGIIFLIVIGLLTYTSSIYMGYMKVAVDNYIPSVNISYNHYLQETNGKNLTNTEKYQTVIMVCDLYSTFPNWCKNDLSKMVGLQ